MPGYIQTVIDRYNDKHGSGSDGQEMTGDELAAIRKRLGLGVVAFGRALGYEGNDNSVSVLVRRYENEGKPIPPWIERLAIMFDRYGIPRDLQ